MVNRENLDQKCINTIRFLSVDAVQRANSGHPGAPMGSAVLAYVLWDRYLRHNPANPNWYGRDRFILSAGHASMLNYSVLHLSGHDVSLEDIMDFRQLHSKTPGHPEYRDTPGVEMTTGPLGQGFAHGVGMAIAERFLAQKYNRDGHEIIDNFTYAMVSDGDLQEGVSYEAANLAGLMGLGKLIYLYMDNDIQIEGSTDLADNENVAGRFRACGWHVRESIDGLDPKAVDNAIKEAQLHTDRPSLIICRTVIGYGSPLENNSASHGAPLGEENIKLAKEKLGWPQEPEFYVPEEVYMHMGQAKERGAELEAAWNTRFENYRKEYPQLAAELEMVLKGELPEGWDKEVNALYPDNNEAGATRKFNGQILNALAKKLPLIGGSADLGPSIQTVIKGESALSRADFSGRNIHFGVREHAMGSIVGGMALYGGLIPYCSTFLIFTDYMRPPMRLAALMGIRALYIYSHDSIALGEDGPTHQPIEQIMNLRGVPNLHVIRPADAHESVEAWKAAVSRKEGPTTLVFTRQTVATFDRSQYPKADGLHKGAYVMWESAASEHDIILIGTGSELEIAVEAGKTLAQEGHKVRVVSMPCWEKFEEQDKTYRDSILTPSVRKRIAVEAGLKQGWEKYTGLDGAVIGMDSFGTSAPAEDLFVEFGITLEKTLEAARELLK